MPRTIVKEYMEAMQTMCSKYNLHEPIEISVWTPRFHRLRPSMGQTHKILSQVLFVMTLVKCSQENNRKHNSL